MEQKLYELLGVKKFRQLAFKLVENILYLDYKRKYSKENAKFLAKKCLSIGTKSNY